MNISVQSAIPCLCKGPDSQVRGGERMIKDTKGKKAFVGICMCTWCFLG